jgi:hypothetical protein
MTKRENYNAIRAIVADNADLVAFIDHELELLDKKNARRSTKPSKTQVANEEIKDVIHDVLLDADAPMMIADIIADDPALVGLSTQKVSALLTQMVASGDVVRTVDKRKSYFAIA